MKKLIFSLILCGLATQATASWTPWTSWRERIADYWTANIGPTAQNTYQCVQNMDKKYLFAGALVGAGFMGGLWYWNLKKREQEVDRLWAHISQLTQQNANRHLKEAYWTHDIWKTPLLRNLKPRDEKTYQVPGIHLENSKILIKKNQGNEVEIAYPSENPNIVVKGNVSQKTWRGAILKQTSLSHAKSEDLD